MSAPKPKFDPTKPYEVVGASKPKFDPTKPYEVVAAAAPSAPATPEEPSVLDQLANYLQSAGQNFGANANRATASIAQGMSLNTAHRWMPELMAGIDEGREMLNATPQADFADRVEGYRKSWARDVDPSLAAAGGVPLMVGLGQAFPAVNAFKGILGFNAASAVGDADRRGINPLSGRGLADIGLNTAISTAVPYGLKGLGWLGGKVFDAAAPVAKSIRKIAMGGYVNPTPEAQRLAAEGVEMTVGRMDPSSTFGRGEELVANKATDVGSSLAAARAKTDRQILDVLIRKAGAPGATPPTPGTPVSAQLDELRSGYSQLYDEALTGQRLDPSKYTGNGKWVGFLTDESLRGAAKTKGAFNAAAEARDISASPDVRSRALDWLTNEAESIRPIKSGPDAGKVDATHIHALRTRLKDEIRSLGNTGDDRALRQIYKRAEEFVTEILHEGLPPDASAKLKAAESTYRNLKATEKAAGGSAAFKNENEFTPAQLLEAIRQKGATPELLAAARDANNVVSATYPATGLQAAAANTPGWRWAVPAWVNTVNSSPGLKAHALGQTPPPWWVKTPVALGDAGAWTGSVFRGATSSPAGPSAAARSLLDLFRSGAGAPVTAEADNQYLPWASR